MRTLESLFLLVLWSLAAFAVVGCSGCAVFRNEPWQGKLYVGDSGKGALVRSEDSEVVSCNDKAVDGMICMSGGDFKDLLTKYREARVNCPPPPPDDPVLTPIAPSPAETPKAVDPAKADTPAAPPAGATP